MLHCWQCMVGKKGNFIFLFECLELVENYSTSINVKVFTVLFFFAIDLQCSNQILVVKFYFAQVPLQSS